MTLRDAAILARRRAMAVEFAKADLTDGGICRG